MSRAELLSTLVFMDTETTGLPSSQFHPHITELSLVAVSRFALEDEVDVPRVQNKLVLCFHPRANIQEAAAKISGLNYKNLYHQKDFDVLAVEQIQSFLLRLDPPICLIAQNGFRFDFPLLKSEILRVKGRGYRLVDSRGEAIVCADTLHLFKAFPEKLIPVTSNDSGYLSTEIEELTISSPTVAEAALPQPKPVATSSPVKPASFSLGPLYTHVFGELHNAAHSAEGDCIAMIRLVKHLDSCAVSWFDSNHRRLSHITPLYQLNESDLQPLSAQDFPYAIKSSSSNESS
ncbi:unnamed protein product [Dibothriocephalus latus]|uniref:Exonuclease domain-containing protein n=1 Tax=Dibothriocephalus latus TaxID=60516 RepID=A0A3P7NUN6_DIBLA|nr:unnamed protein product [Dibothriocephalus latus]